MEAIPSPRSLEVHLSPFDSAEQFDQGEGQIELREQLGGVLRYYYRDAAQFTSGFPRRCALARSTAAQFVFSIGSTKIQAIPTKLPTLHDISVVGVLHLTSSCNQGGYQSCPSSPRQPNQWTAWMGQVEIREPLTARRP